MESMKEKNILIQQVNDDAISRDITLQFEKLIILLGRPDLIGLLLSLLLLNQIKYINFKTQKHLAKVIGFSEPTFIRKRKELEDLQIIKIIDKDNRRIIDLNFLSRLKFFKLPKDPVKQLDYLVRIKKTIIPISEKEAQMSLSSSIYIYNNINNNNNIYTKKIKKMKFPKEDYDLVLQAFKKYKGVALYGPEVAQHLRAIKTMFKSNHKPKEVIDFMKWLSAHEQDRNTPWVKNWTIWTVQKKLSEFLAGKLQVRSLEDQYPIYGR